MNPDGSAMAIMPHFPEWRDFLVSYNQQLQQYKVNAASESRR